MKDVYTAIAGLALMGIGAYLNYLFTKKAEARRNLENLRTQAYLDYLKTATELMLGNKDGTLESELVTRMYESTLRICLYGTREVIQMMAQMEKSRNETQGKDVVPFLELCTAMRRSSATTGKSASNDDLERILFPGRFRKKQADG
jgi:hypothetical protein